MIKKENTYPRPSPEQEMIVGHINNKMNESMHSP